MKKAMELSILCSCDVGFVIFNRQGRMYQFASNGEFDATIERARAYKSAQEFKSNDDVQRSLKAAEQRREDRKRLMDSATGVESQESSPHRPVPRKPNPSALQSVFSSTPTGTSESAKPHAFVSEESTAFQGDSGAIPPTSFISTPLGRTPIASSVGVGTTTLSTPLGRAHMQCGWPNAGSFSSPTMLIGGFGFGTTPTGMTQMAFGSTPLGSYRPSLRESRDDIEPGVAMDGIQTEGFTPLSSMHHHPHMPGIPFLRQTAGIPSLPTPMASSAFQTTSLSSHPLEQEEFLQDVKDGDGAERIIPSLATTSHDKHDGIDEDHVEIGKKRELTDKEKDDEALDKEAGTSLRKRRKGLRHLSIKVETTTQEKYVTARFSNSLESKERAAQGGVGKEFEVEKRTEEGGESNGKDDEEKQVEDGRTDSGPQLSPTDGTFASTRFKDFIDQQYFGKALGSKDVSTPRLEEGPFRKTEHDR
eukprot:TRINITY_DN3709_c0_g1_i3.p1 TRINITY_DN3709_c0_g1~~TRINITY_DN3709_c0_g1_i3.p1  ORF type:complete len:475 (+),score=145.26 TRINITY_DN3709_c0_g1_i3:129-1553(+)